MTGQHCEPSGDHVVDSETPGCNIFQGHKCMGYVAKMANSISDMDGIVQDCSNWSYCSLALSHQCGAC